MLCFYSYFSLVVYIEVLKPFRREHIKYSLPYVITSRLYEESEIRVEYISPIFRPHISYSRFALPKADVHLVDKPSDCPIDRICSMAIDILSKELNSVAQSTASSRGFVIFLGAWYIVRITMNRRFEQSR